MWRFLLSLAFLSIVGCAFAQRHHVQRRGIHIRGSYGQGPPIGSGYLSNRFGDAANRRSNQTTNNRRIQIRGSYGGSSSGSNSNASAGSGFLGNRFGESAASGSGSSGGAVNGGLVQTHGITGVEFLDGFNGNRLEVTAESESGLANGGVGIKFLDGSSESLNGNQPEISSARGSGGFVLGNLANGQLGAGPSRTYLPVN